VQKVFFDYVEDGERSGPGLPDRTRSVRQNEGGHNYESAATTNSASAPGKLKLIGLDRYAQTPSDTTVETMFDDGTPTEGSRFTSDAEEEERIARAEYRWKWGGDWQLSGEYAFNSLDNASRLFVLDPLGAYQEIPLPGGTAVVQEDRYEVMATYGRKLGADVTFQLSAGGEYSRLEQVGGGGLHASFRRPKGPAHRGVEGDAEARRQLQAAAPRRPARLQRLPRLGGPQRRAGERRQPGPRAAADLGNPGSRRSATSARSATPVSAPYYQRIDDIVDTIPIGDHGESPGNIDRATVRGVEWKATIQGDSFGCAGGKIDATVQFEDSDVIDPLTGEHRPISNNLKEAWELSLRQDVPNTAWAWGTDINYSFYARDYRLTEVGRFWEGPIWGSAYVERKDFHGVTARVSLGNMFNAMSMWDRTVYEDRRTGPVDFIEDRHRRIGPILSLTLSGKF
jgi:hypothetical protein